MQKKIITSLFFKQDAEKSMKKMTHDRVKSNEDKKKKRPGGHVLKTRTRPSKKTV